MSGLIAKMSVVPGPHLRPPCGLQTGVAADITLIDPDREFTIDPSIFRSRSRNSPFVGSKVNGRAVMTIVGGKVVFEYNFWLFFKSQTTSYIFQFLSFPGSRPACRLDNSLTSNTISTAAGACRYNRQIYDARLLRESRTQTLATYEIKKKFDIL